MSEPVLAPPELFLLVNRNLRSQGEIERPDTIARVQHVLETERERHQRVEVALVDPDFRGGSSAASGEPHDKLQQEQLGRQGASPLRQRSHNSLHDCSRIGAGDRRTGSTPRSCLVGHWRSSPRRELNCEPAHILFGVSESIVHTDFALPDSRLRDRIPGSPWSPLVHVQISLPFRSPSMDARSGSLRVWRHSD